MSTTWWRTDTFRLCLRSHVCTLKAKSHSARRTFMFSLGPRGVPSGTVTSVTSSSSAPRARTKASRKRNQWIGGGVEAVNCYGSKTRRLESPRQDLTCMPSEKKRKSTAVNSNLRHKFRMDRLINGCNQDEEC